MICLKWLFEKDNHSWNVNTVVSITDKVENKNISMYTDTGDLNNTIDYSELTDIYKIQYPKLKNNIPFQCSSRKIICCHYLSLK